MNTYTSCSSTRTLITFSYTFSYMSIRLVNFINDNSHVVQTRVLVCRRMLITLVALQLSRR